MYLTIMYYTEPNTDWWTFNNNSFVPVFTDDVDNWEWGNGTLKEDAFALCGNDTACLIDVYITGDIAVGESTKATSEQSAKADAELSEFYSRIV